MTRNTIPYPLPRASSNFIHKDWLIISRMIKGARLFHTGLKTAKATKKGCPAKGLRNTPSVPHWIENGEGHEERMSSERAQKYPFLCLSNHPRWRVHSQHDDMQWLREIETCKITGPDGYGYQTLWINPQDAEKKGIKQHDIVKAFNERGGVLFGAYVTERIMPGVIYIDHGARLDPIVTGELDRGGAINTLTPRNTVSKNSTGMVSGGFLLDVEKADLDDLMQKYPEAFKRAYNSNAGLTIERLLEK